MCQSIRSHAAPCQALPVSCKDADNKAKVLGVAHGWYCQSAQQKVFTDGFVMIVALFPATISVLISKQAQVYCRMSFYMTPTGLFEHVWNSARETLHPQQYTRLFRGVTEDIRLLKFVEAATVWMFMIQASSGSLYMIRNNKATRHAECSRPDARNQPDMACKHVCWLVFVLFKLTDLGVLADGAVPEPVVTGLDRKTLLATSVQTATRPVPNMGYLGLFAGTPASRRTPAGEAGVPTISRGGLQFCVEC